MGILIVTENIFNEQQLHQNLQRLNYEVFTSYEVLKNWRKYQTLGQWANLFSIIIVSETISTSESYQLIESVQNQEVVFLRKLDEEPSEVMAQELTTKGYNGWLSTTATLAELREMLFACRKVPAAIEPLHREKPIHSISAWDLLRMNLSTIDEKILQSLMEHGTTTISREELIQEIWESEPNNSNLSQLSFRVGRLKQNIQDTFGVEAAIVTDWRKGYRLSQEFHDLFLNKVEFG